MNDLTSAVEISSSYIVKQLVESLQWTDRSRAQF